MELGSFSVSLAVKDIAASRAFYEKLGFASEMDGSEGWLILKNGDTVIGLFQGMFEAPSGARTIGYWKNHDEERDFFINNAVLSSSVYSSIDDLNVDLSKKGKKSMVEKARQQLSALLLNMASSLDPYTVLGTGELEILQMINLAYDATATVDDATSEIENAILNSTDKDVLENAKDLADEINNRDHRN